jgi:hypothetical protein
MTRAFTYALKQNFLSVYTSYAVRVWERLRRSQQSLLLPVRAASPPAPAAKEQFWRVCNSLNFPLKK